MTGNVSRGTYSTLTTDCRQFRLLQVSIGDDDIIDCHLSTVFLDAEVKYRALSYVWGVAKATHMIRLDGQPFLVRPTLFHFLISAAMEKKSSQSLGIFIDAICINQHDLAERSSQVTLMGEIYSRAVEVVVWFGREESWVSWLTFKYPMIEDPETLRSCFGPKNDFPLDEADVSNIRKIILVKLIEHEYWTRVWTVQEFLLPSKLQLCFGILQLPGICFIDGVRQDFWGHDMSMDALGVMSMQKWMSANATEDADNARCWQFVAERTRRHAGMESGAALDSRLMMPLHRALNSFSEQRCSEQRDKVFGFLGLCGSHITVDYKMPKSMLYLHALMICLREMLSSTEIDVVKNTLPVSNLITALSSSLGLSLSNDNVLVLTLLAMDVLEMDKASAIAMLALTSRVRHPLLYKMLLQHSSTIEVRVADVELKQISRRMEQLWEGSAVVMLPDGDSKTMENWEKYLRTLINQSWSFGDRAINH